MRKHIYADESGNFDFSTKPSASRYFILTTVVIDNHDIADELAKLRRDLTWEGFNLEAGFHAAEDKQSVRDAVFDVLQSYSFRVDATILDKRKTQPKLKPTDMQFYKHAWFYHMKYVAPMIATRRHQLLVIAATIATHRKSTAAREAVKDVMAQVSPTSARVALWRAASDPCLQVADYCCWAIQRKWERGDDRSYQLIESKIQSEFDIFKSGTVCYY